MSPATDSHLSCDDEAETSGNLPDYKKIQNGDPDAWKDGYRILWGVAHAACYAALRNCPGVDKDLVIADAVTEVIGKVSGIKSWDELKAQTARISYCRAIDAIRKTKAQKHGGGQLDSLKDLLVEPASPQSRRPDEDLYHKEIWGGYQRCAKQLKPKSRKVMELRLLEQFTQKEISQELQIPQGTVGVMIMQVLEAVRRCLAARGIVP